ncbi:MAG: hypothetical protein ACR2RF_26250 [Geminicoccaceae bacterium]
MSDWDNLDERSYDCLQNEIERLTNQRDELREPAQAVVNAFGEYERKTSPELPDGWWSPMGRLIDTEHIANLADTLANLNKPASGE